MTLKKHESLPIAEAAKHYQSGASSYKLGRKYGVSRNIILEELRLHNEPIRRPGNQPALTLTDDELLQRVNAGQTYEQIGNEFSVTQWAVGKRVRRARKRANLEE